MIVRAAIALLIGAALCWPVSAAWRSQLMYSELKLRNGWSGHVLKSDPELGYCGIPHARGAQLVAIPPDVSACFDEDGLRVPCETRAGPERPLILALGCSFTYGYACRAEEAFPELIARALGGKCKNAGLPGYGLAQMLIQARRLIPRYRPEIVLLQYSPWLVDRSRHGEFGKTIGRVVAPVFVEGDGGVELKLPPRCYVFDLPFEEFAVTPAGIGDWLSFQARVGFPLRAREDIQSTGLWISGLFSTDPEIASEERIVDSAYAEFAALCAANGSRMIVVCLWRNLPVEPVVPQGVVRTGCELVLPLHELGRRLEPERTIEKYVRTYCLWRGDPPRPIDAHPNALAHAIIAEEILKVVSR